MVAIVCCCFACCALPPKHRHTYTKVIPHLCLALGSSSKHKYGEPESVTDHKMWNVKLCFWILYLLCELQKKKQFQKQTLAFSVFFLSFHMGSINQSMITLRSVWPDSLICEMFLKNIAWFELKLLLGSQFIAINF